LNSQLILLLDYIDAPHTARLFLDFAKSNGSIQMGRRCQRAHRPEDHAAIAALPGELHRFLEQFLPQPRAPRGRINQKPAKPCDISRVAEEGDAANESAIFLGNPKSLTR